MPAIFSQDPAIPGKERLKRSRKTMREPLFCFISTQEGEYDFLHRPVVIHQDSVSEVDFRYEPLERSQSISHRFRLSVGINLVLQIIQLLVCLRTEIKLNSGFFGLLGDIWHFLWFLCSIFFSLAKTKFLPSPGDEC